MDDLDHSMHIAEYDWTSFFEESEECGLLKPSFAYPDNLSLSDSEDSGNSSSVSTGQQGRQQQSLSANSEEADSNAAGRIEGVQISQRALGGESVDLEICLCYPDINNINITEETNDETAIRPQTEQLNVQSLEAESTEIKKEERDVQTERDTCKLKSIQGPDPLACNQPENNANEQHTTERAVSEDVSSVAEKERWFVTINENPARQRVRAPPLKKKRRQKKNRKDNHMCRTPCQEKSLETASELEIVKDNRESEGGRNTLAGYSSAEENPVSDQVRVISDLSHMSSEEDNLSEKQVMSHHNTENIIEPMRDSNTHEPSSLAATLFGSFVPADPSRLDRVESEEFFSTHSYDSESYLSATESVEEPQHLLIENRQPQCSSPLTDSFLFNPTENTHADETQDRELPSCESTLSCNVRAANCEGYQSTEVEPIQTFQPAGQSANKMPDDESECDKDSTLPCMPTDTPGPQTREINLSVSGCSSGSQPSLLPVPDLTVTPCSVADTPETYAKGEGDPRPVYAISAFWDEMEKLTINDILRLRMGRSPSPRDTQETVTPDLAESPRNQSPLGDTVEYSLSDGVLMDTSDTADSDYFTQPDESKPGRSSCEFSTSDFEEEYWQFLGSSRNPSPDPQRKNHKGTSESPHFEEEGSASSEGKMTPVPTEDFTRQCFEYLDSNDITSSKHAWPRPMPKNKSLFNVQALNTEDVSLQLLLGNDESSLFLSNDPSLEENVFLKASDSLGTPICAPFLPNTHLLDAYDQISVSDVVEYFSPEDKAKGDSLSVTVYDPDNISVAPLFDYTLCTFRDETPFFSLYDFQCTERKPIPIFSCSHPTVREITFPNPDFAFLSADWKVQEDISPTAVVSRAFVQGSDCGTFEVALQGFCGWKSFLPMRKIRFHDKGSIWCGRAGTWVFPVDADKIIIKRADPPVSVFTEKGVASTPSTLLRDLAVQQVVLEAIQTRREGIFSTLKQSDMCLVCIAFASWVLRSSDPEAADTWKAALLANVSALSAIQYLRQYVRKKNPSQDHP